MKLTLVDVACEAQVEIDHWLWELDTTEWTMAEMYEAIADHLKAQATMMK